MRDPNQIENTPGTLLEWIEPEVRQLDVRETAFRPTRGGDGEAMYPDCNHS